MIAAEIPDALLVGLVLVSVPIVVGFFSWMVLQIQAIRSNTDVTKEILANHERRLTEVEKVQDSLMVPAWRVTTQTTTVAKDPEA